MNPFTITALAFALIVGVVLGFMFKPTGGKMVVGLLICLGSIIAMYLTSPVPLTNILWGKFPWGVFVPLWGEIVVTTWIVFHAIRAAFRRQDNLHIFKG